MKKQASKASKTQAKPVSKAKTAKIPPEEAPQKEVVCDKVIDAVTDMVALRYHFTQIKRRIEKLVNREISNQSVNAVIAEVRARMQQRWAPDQLGRRKEEAHEFFDEVLRSSESSYTDKVKAQIALNDMLGFNAKNTVPERELTPEQQASLVRSAVEKMKATVPRATKPVEAKRGK